MAAFTQNWKRQLPHLTMAKWLRIWPNTNSVVIPSIRKSNRQNVSTETKWSRNSTAQTRNVCGRVYRQSQTTKRKPAMSRTPTSCFLPDKLNTFFARFEDNTVPCGPLPRTVGSHCPWLTWVKHLSVLSFARLPAHTASLAASTEHAQTSWLVCLRTYSISPYPSLLSPYASRCPPLFLYPRK